MLVPLNVIVPPVASTVKFPEPDITPENVDEIASNASVLSPVEVNECVQ